MISLTNKHEPVAGVEFDNWMLTVGGEEAGVRVTRGQLDREGRWHAWRPDVFLLWRGCRLDTRYELGKLKERALMWLVWKLPRRVAYWAAIRVGAHATTGPYGDQIVPELLFMDALKRWDPEGEPVDG